MDLSRAGRLVFTLLLALYGFSILRHPDAGSLVDNIDLPIHETGHLVFSPFGEFVQFLGGTLFQLIMPSVFVGYFVMRRDRYAGGVALWWVAQNLSNISVYVRDARAQELPLVGGGEHDWAYLLGRLGWMQRDQTIGAWFSTAALVVFVVAIGVQLFALTVRLPAAEPADALGASDGGR